MRQCGAENTSTSSGKGAMFSPWSRAANGGANGGASIRTARAPAPRDRGRRPARARLAPPLPARSGRAEPASARAAAGGRCAPARQHSPGFVPVSCSTTRLEIRCLGNAKVAACRCKKHVQNQLCWKRGLRSWTPARDRAPCLPDHGTECHVVFPSTPPGRMTQSPPWAAHSDV